MCGIAGFWQTGRGRIEETEILMRMGGALRHRGPDDCGTFFDPSSGLGMVHRRLSILDLSSAGHQPMVSSSGRYTIVFNGEVYNCEEIRSELGSGYKWRGHSDTEVMLAAFDRWGLGDALKHFVGMFAFALWDRSEGNIHLVRDRLGIKPLYYGFVGADFVFSSELKGLRQYPSFEGQIDLDALALYMRHNYVPSPHSIYKGIYKLPPGCMVTLTAPHAKPQLHRFWSATEIAQNGLKSRLIASDSEIVELLEGKLREAVGLRMIADVPLGAFLSGGVDSSTVVALMQAQSNRPVKTFTIGFNESEYDEGAHAKRVAVHLGTDHTELYLRPEDALNVIPSLSSIYDEPFADSSQIPTLLVSQLARQHVKVSLSGDGGDELFGGYNRYTLIKSIWDQVKPFPAFLRRFAADLIQAVPPRRIDLAYQLVKPLLPVRKRLSSVGDKAHKFAGFLELQGPESMYLQALSHWTPPSEVVPGSREPDTIASFIQQSSWLPSIEEVMMLTDIMNYLPDDILTKVDRASMAVGLEARVPMLDHRVVDFAWTLPLSFKIRCGRGKWILRQLLHKYVPPELIERPKMGFAVPIQNWLRGALREWAEDLLSAEALGHHNLFNAEIIRVCWKEHLSGTRNWQYLLWDVLIFQDWYFQNLRGAHIGQPAIFGMAGSPAITPS
jgi:asparagine synthase (glutamine-hydrolysing)